MVDGLGGEDCFGGLGGEVGFGGLGGLLVGHSGALHTQKGSVHGQVHPGLVFQNVRLERPRAVGAAGASDAAGALKVVRRDAV